jgi:hypothetical protein
MRVLLDTSDIINVVERSGPISFDRFEAFLRANGALLVLTFTTVLEFVRPVLDHGDFLRLRPPLQSLERLPLAYLSDAHIPMQELKSACEAFLAGAECCAVDPYVRRWEETAQFLGQSCCRMLVDFRIDEAIYMIWRSNPEALRGPVKETEHLRAIVAKDRQIPRIIRINAAHNFSNALRKYLRRSDLYGFTFPTNRVDEIAKWIYSDPRRCPGLRLHYDLYHQMLADVYDEPKDGDIPDHSLAGCLPYVDAITLDRRLAHHVRAVCKRLESAGPARPRYGRIYCGLRALFEEVEEQPTDFDRHESPE